MGGCQQLGNGVRADHKGAPRNLWGVMEMFCYVIMLHNCHNSEDSPLSNSFTVCKLYLKKPNQTNRMQSHEGSSCFSNQSDKCGGNSGPER